MHPEQRHESTPALHGITAESLLAAQPLPAWVCLAATMEILAANGAGAWHLGGVHEALHGRVLTGERLALPTAHALTAWAASGPGRELLWALQRIDGSLLETRVAATPLIGDGPERLLVVALPTLLDREGAPAARRRCCARPNASRWSCSPAEWLTISTTCSPPCWAT